MQPISTFFIIAYRKFEFNIFSFKKLKKNEEKTKPILTVGIVYLQNKAIKSSI